MHKTLLSVENQKVSSISAGSSKCDSYTNQQNGIRNDLHSLEQVAYGGEIGYSDYSFQQGGYACL
jgi:hypothetical protein